MPSDAQADVATSPITLGHPPGAAGRWITWRSTLLGTLSVILVCGLTPYNDYIVANTYMVGSYWPIGMTLCLFVLAVLVNAPLHRWLPRHALSSGELGVILAMMLVACAIPSQGMMRTVVPTLVAPLYMGQSHPKYWDLLLGLHLPRWLFPVRDLGQAPTHPLVTDFYGRVAPGDPIPYGPWLVPLAGWCVFFGGVIATLLSLAALFRYQWAVNERLPFPLAQLQGALIEAPAPGRALNGLFRSRPFWLAVFGVMLVHGLSGLSRYFPRHVPVVPLDFDLASIMTTPPWLYLGGAVKAATVYFTFIGIGYFIQSRLSFSLWGIFLIWQFLLMGVASNGYEIPTAAWDDQHIGACAAYALAMLWVGRHHWWRIGRQALGRTRRGEMDGDFGSYRIPVLGLVGGVSAMVGWLLLMGVQWWVTLGIVFFILLAHVVTARIVAETGMPWARTNATFPQVYTALPPAMMTTRDVFFTGIFTLNGPFNTRESLLAFGQHAMQVNAEFEPEPRRRRRLLALLAWATALGFVVAAFSSIRCYYRYALPLSPRVYTGINYHVTTVLPERLLVEPMIAHAGGQYPAKAHNPWLHMAIGAAVVLALQAGAWRWAAWPLLPVGYVLLGGPFIYGAWFSIFLGWLAKVLILQFGGAKFFQAARPFFIGLIFGEALAAGVWMIVSLVLSSGGWEYESIMLLPS